jgi:hypothetical protein
MKKLLLLLLLLPILSYSQNKVDTVFSQKCVKIDTVFSTAKLRELGSRDIKFGVKQIVEDELSSTYCLSENGLPISVEIFYFGIPKTTIRIVGIEQTNQITQVGIRLKVNGKKIDGYGESETEVRAIMIELVDGKVPFSKTTLSSAIKKAVHDAVTQIKPFF